MKVAPLVSAIVAAPLLVAVVSAPLFAQAGDSQKTEPKGAAEERFLKVMQASCVRCHPVCNNVDALVGRKWIVPGKPESSPLFTNLGKGKKKNVENGRYHNVSAEAKAAIRDFITQYQADNAGGK